MYLYTLYPDPTFLVFQIQILISLCPLISLPLPNCNHEIKLVRLQTMGLLLVSIQSTSYDVRILDSRYVPNMRSNIVHFYLIL